mmetsp:Transcript_8501/g.22763  ORF Transcript_8501/g.22763 Transcript_8501/m.22763 type:complete len:126 (-) Transcript_8501:774-1151(-)
MQPGLQVRMLGPVVGPWELQVQWVQQGRQALLVLVLVMSLGGLAVWVQVQKVVQALQVLQVLVLVVAQGCQAVLVQTQQAQQAQQQHSRRAQQAQQAQQQGGGHWGNPAFGLPQFEQEHQLQWRG